MGIDLAVQRSSRDDIYALIIHHQQTLRPFISSMRAHTFCFQSFTLDYSKVHSEGGVAKIGKI